MRPGLRILLTFLPATALALSELTGGLSAATNAPTLRPGRQPDGSMLLPNQWSLRPAGRHVELGDFPVNIAVHPGSRFAAVLHSGYSQHEIIVVELAAGRVVSRTNVAEAFYGLQFSRDGRQLFCSGGGGEVIHAYPFHEGDLTGEESIRLHDVKERAVPVGLALDPAGRTLFAANLWNSRVSLVDLETKSVRDIVLATNGPLVAPALVEPSEQFDTVSTNRRPAAARYPNDPHGAFPYACALDAKRHRLYVSLWGQSAVAVVDLQTESMIARWETGEHPCELALRRDGRFLFVATANQNTVTVLDARTGQTVETIWATLYASSPLGATPSSLALSPDEKLLFVANADINAVAVFDVAKPGWSRCLGFIPTGWYPTCVRVTPDGQRLLIASGKGLVAKANPAGPQPGRASSKEEYIGRLFRGTLTVIEIPERAKFIQQLGAWTADAFACSPLRPDASVGAARPAGNPIPAKPGDPSPITNCIYIVKENRTYDQVLGDLREGNGDPKLCLFPERVTPNHHQLAREFVLLDNFYVDAEVSADGHEWTMGAYATDFVEKTWPMNYGHNKSAKFPYPAEGNFDIARPASGYLWDRARVAGVSYRSYGEFVQNGRNTNAPVTARLRTLEGHFDPWFRGFDLNYPDAKRADRFIAELKRFEQEGDMPRLQIVRLPSDHTHGVTAGFRTPTAYVAENDLALGRVIEAVSRSKFWPHTAIFIVEDDAQNGPDHVDAHRTVAFVVSPYTRRGVVDSTLYSTSSMLRTMELILGLQPMTQFDAAATPMFDSFQAAANLQSYTALPANVDLNERNSAVAWGADLKFNFAKEDAADDFLFNEVIWRSVKGTDHPMPAPVHAGFVFTHSGDKDD